MAINTIRGLLDHRIGLAAFCNVCRPTVLLDLDARRQRLGFDHSTLHDDLAPKLRCSACGSRDVGLIVRPQTGFTDSGSADEDFRP